MQIKRSPNPRHEKIEIRSNFWGMIVASINKGQFPFIILGIVSIVLIIRLPPNDVVSLTDRVLEHFNLMYVGGWLLSFLLIILWIILGRMSKKDLIDELNRISKEKEYLYKLLLDKTNPHG
jgi:hypothetical protein